MCIGHRYKLRPSFSDLSLIVAIISFPVLFLGGDDLAAAEQGEDATWIHFDIPAQPLASALTAYGSSARVAVFVAADLVVSRRSVALKGVFSTEAGLQSLLVGTGLVAVPMGSGFAVMSADGARTEANSGGSQSPPVALPFASYSALLQGKLRRTLCAREETRPGNYRILIRLWIDRWGSMANVRLLTSTGDAKRDSSLYSALHGLALGESPPTNLPQPITLLVAPGDKNASLYCAASAPPRIQPLVDSERPR